MNIGDRVIVHDALVGFMRHLGKRGTVLAIEGKPGQRSMKVALDGDTEFESRMFGDYEIRPLDAIELLGELA